MEEASNEIISGWLDYGFKANAIRIANALGEQIRRELKVETYVDPKGGETYPGVERLVIVDKDNKDQIVAFSLSIIGNRCACYNPEYVHLKDIVEELFTEPSNIK